MDKILIIILIVLGVLVAGGIVAAVVSGIRRRIRLFSNTALGAVLQRILAKDSAVVQDETTPRSLSGGDSLFRSSILKDFPDFNFDMAKKYVRERMTEELGDRPDFRFHKCIINDYRRSNVDKTIIYQAAVQYREDNILRQKRYFLHYSYTMDHSDFGQREHTVAATCPQCGAPIGSSSETVCSYCGCRLADVLGNTWRFTEVYESE